LENKNTKKNKKLKKATAILDVSVTGSDNIKLIKKRETFYTNVK
jgi:hypothetical protein